ncbi:MAG: class I SAM-dependent methyltransferase [Planctomycetes bacterium]|nr:class I SAM-dependent methyltransferase [Planctomycetota bacterium]
MRRGGTSRDRRTGRGRVPSAAARTKPYDLFAPLYDGDVEVLRASSGDVAFYVEEARRSRGPVLELACGTGRVLLPTARAGVEVVGLDASRAMLGRLRGKLAAEPPEVRARVQVVEGDMVSSDLGRRFPLVTAPFRSIGHLLEVDAQVAAFENMRRHLATGGRLAFDFFHPDLGRLAAPQPERLDIERVEGGRRVRRFSSTIPRVARQILDLDVRWELETPRGKVEEVRISLSIRWFHRFEIEHLLARSGLLVEAIYGGFDRRPLADDSPEMVFLARAAT